MSQPSSVDTLGISVGLGQLGLPSRVHPGLSCGAAHMDVASFIEKWRESGSSERANKDMFLIELCDLLGVPRPAPTTGDPSRDLYVFEKSIPVPLEGGTKTTWRADLYKHAFLVLEAKQSLPSAAGKTGSARRKESARILAEAFDQARDYALALDVPPPFIVLCDIGYCFELYANFEGKRTWQPFPDAQRHTLFLLDLANHLDMLRAVFTEPFSLIDRHFDKPACITLPNAIGASPFEPGIAVAPERFIGRDLQRAAVKVRIGGISAQCVSIVGQYRSGKSSLLKYIHERIGEFCTVEQKPLVVLLDLQATKHHSPEGVLEGIRREIERQTGMTPWRREDNADGFAVDDGLAALHGRGVRLIVVLLDELERIGARLDRFQDWGEDFRAKATAGYLALVIASRRSLAQVYLDCRLTSPFGNIFMLVTLGAMPREEWILLVRQGFQRTHVDVTNADIDLIDDLAGGLPYYVQMAAMLLWHHRNHDTVRREFQFQTRERFMELWGGLSAMEQRALRHRSGASRGIDISRETMQDLERFGLIRPSGGLFSTSFAAFVREQR